MSFPASKLNTRQIQTREEYETDYLAQLDARVQRSEVIGSSIGCERNVVLLFDPIDQHFTVLEKEVDAEETAIFDTAKRFQWERQALIIGHSTRNGGFAACGHAFDTGHDFLIHFGGGRDYRLKVDMTKDYLVQYQCPPEQMAVQSKKRSMPSTMGSPKQKLQKARFAPDPLGRSRHVTHADSQVDTGSDGEDGDLTEEDLRRLRGEVSMESKRKRR